MTEIVDSIRFSRKEYIKALENVVNKGFDSMVNQMETSFAAMKCFTLSDNYILTYLSEGGVRKYFIFPSNIEVRNPQKADELKNDIGDRWLKTWPTEEQIKHIAEIAYTPSAFIYSENESGNCAVLKKEEDGTWIKEDFKRPARPVSVLNISERDVRAVLLFVLRNKYKPASGAKNEPVTVEIVSDIIASLKTFDSSSKKIEISVDDIPNIKITPDIETIIKNYLLKSLQLQPNFTTNDVKEYLKKSDFLRAGIPVYTEDYFKDETQWLWELWPENSSSYGVEIPSSGEKIRARNPSDDVNRHSVIAIDFGTSSTVVVEYDPSHPDKPRQICVGNLAEDKYENPTLMLIQSYGDFLASYYSKDCRPYTNWNDLMVSHEVKNRMGNANNEEFKAVVSHIKQWAADPKSTLNIKPIKESDPITLKPLSELFGREKNEDFNPIEVYAYFLGLYLNNRHSGYGIYLNYQLSYPATYNEDVRRYICESFKRGLRKSIPSAIKDEEIIVEMKISEPEAYAVTAMKRYMFEPEQDEKVKYAIFDFGGGTSDFAYGYWSKADSSEEGVGYEWKIETLDVNGEQYLGGENILDRLAFEVFSDPINLATMKAKNCKFYYGIEQLDKSKGVDEQVLADNFYAKNNMATLIDWSAGDEQVDADGIFGRGLRVFWENQEKYFPEYLSDATKTNEMMILINEIEMLLKGTKDEEARRELENLLKTAQEYNNEYNKQTVTSSLAYLKDKYNLKLDNAIVGVENEYKIKPTLYNTSSNTENLVEILVSKAMMYKHFSTSINDGINSFFSALKNAFEKDSEYSGSINIFLAGNSSKSPILIKLMKEKIKKESNEQVTFKLFNRFDSSNYEEELRDSLRAQGWEEEDIDDEIKDQRQINPKFKPTGKTGVAFGIVEVEKGKIQVKRRKTEYFKYYLGDCKTNKGDRFVPFEGFRGQKPAYPNAEWIETFVLPPSEMPRTVTLYYTTKPECVDGKQKIAIASTHPLTIPSVKQGEKVYIKAAGVDKIYYVVARDEEAAENKIKDATIDLEKCTAILG